MPAAELRAIQSKLSRALSGARKKTGSKRRNRRQQGDRGIPSSFIPPKALPNRTINRTNRSETERGSDFLMSVSVPESVARGAELVNLMLNPAMTRRMKACSSRFQRVRWLNFNIRVVANFSTNAAGSYVAAIIRDPTDIPPEDTNDRIQWACNSKASSLVKFWQETTVGLSERALLYTSSGDDTSDVRLYSPGQLYIFAVDEPWQKGSLAIWVDWQFEFSQPSFEIPREIITDKSVEIPYDIGLVKYPYDQGYMGLMRPKGMILSRKPDVHFDDWDPLDMDELGFSEFADGTYFRCSVPAIINAQFTAGDGHPGVPYMIHYWKKDTLPIGQSSTSYPTLVPTVLYHRDGRLYEMTDFAYVNSTSAGDVWADLYSCVYMFPRGTRFTEYKPFEQTERIYRTTMIDGKVTKIPTSNYRRVRSMHTPEEVSQNVPQVRVAGKITVNPTNNTDPQIVIPMQPFDSVPIESSITVDGLTRKLTTPNQGNPAPVVLYGCDFPASYHGTGTMEGVKVRPFLADGAGRVGVNAVMAQPSTAETQTTYVDWSGTGLKEKVTLQVPACNSSNQLETHSSAVAPGGIQKVSIYQPDGRLTFVDPELGTLTSAVIDNNTGDFLTTSKTVNKVCLLQPHNTVGWNQADEMGNIYYVTPTVSSTGVLSTTSATVDNVSFPDIQKVTIFQPNTVKSVNDATLGTLYASPADTTGAYKVYNTNGSMHVKLDQGTKDELEPLYVVPLVVDPNGNDHTPRFNTLFPINGVPTRPDNDLTALAALSLDDSKGEAELNVGQSSRGLPIAINWVQMKDYPVSGFTFSDPEHPDAGAMAMPFVAPMNTSDGSKILSSGDGRLTSTGSNTLGSVYTMPGPTNKSSASTCETD